MEEFPLSKSNWANGQPSIEIHSYEHTKKAFESILGKVSRAFEVPGIEYKALGLTAIPELMVYDADFIFKTEPATLHMDEFSCSIAFNSESVRDEAYLLLLPFL
jgi:hypothetical protein